jgi:hypothetical protein
MKEVVFDSAMEIRGLSAMVYMIQTALDADDCATFVPEVGIKSLFYIHTRLDKIYENLESAKINEARELNARRRDETAC